MTPFILLLYQHEGEGLQSHPRLSTDLRYRCSRNITTMREARELLLEVAPAGFEIARSTCYNYTSE